MSEGKNRPLTAYKEAANDKINDAASASAAEYSRFDSVAARASNAWHGIKQRSPLLRPSNGPTNIIDVKTSLLAPSHGEEFNNLILDQLPTDPPLDMNADSDTGEGTPSHRQRIKNRLKHAKLAIHSGSATPERQRPVHSGFATPSRNNSGDDNAYLQPNGYDTPGGTRRWWRSSRAGSETPSGVNSQSITPTDDGTSGSDYFAYKKESSKTRAIREMLASTINLPRSVRAPADPFKALEDATEPSSGRHKQKQKTKDALTRIEELVLFPQHVIESHRGHHLEVLVHGWIYSYRPTDRPTRKRRMLLALATTWSGLPKLPVVDPTALAVAGDEKDGTFYRGGFKTQGSASDLTLALNDVGSEMNIGFEDDREDSSGNEKRKGFGDNQDANDGIDSGPPTRVGSYDLSDAEADSQSTAITGRRSSAASSTTDLSSYDDDIRTVDEPLLAQSLPTTRTDIRHPTKQTSDDLLAKSLPNAQTPVADFTPKKEASSNETHLPIKQPSGDDLHLPHHISHTLHNNLLSRLAPFFGNHVSRRRVRVQVWTQDEAILLKELELMTSDVGHFSARIPLDLTSEQHKVIFANGANADPAVVIRAVYDRTPGTVNPSKDILGQAFGSVEGTTPAVLQPIYSSRGVSMVSDIDDTLKFTAITEGPRAIFWNTFLRELSDLSIPGVPDWYNHMKQNVACVPRGRDHGHQHHNIVKRHHHVRRSVIRWEGDDDEGVAGGELPSDDKEIAGGEPSEVNAGQSTGHLAGASRVRFHYVSNGPWQLWPGILRHFFSHEDLPLGSFHLKMYTSSGTLKGLFEGSSLHKKNSLKTLMRDFPKRAFILCGDSGEVDLEVYTDIALKFPKQVLGIFIRNVSVAVGARTGSITSLKSPSSTDVSKIPATQEETLKPRPRFGRNNSTPSIMQSRRARTAPSSPALGPIQAMTPLAFDLDSKMPTTPKRSDSSSSLASQGSNSSAMGGFWRRVSKCEMLLNRLREQEYMEEQARWSVHAALEHAQERAKKKGRLGIRQKVQKQADEEKMSPFLKIRVWHTGQEAQVQEESEELVRLWCERGGH